MGVVLLIVVIAFAVFLGSMGAKSTDVDKFKAGVIMTRATAGYIVPIIMALATLGYVLQQLGVVEP